MIKRLSLSCFLLFQLLEAPVLGQVKKLTSADAESFSTDSVLLHFGGQENGARVSDLFAKWGLTFGGTGATVQKIKTRTVFLQFSTKFGPVNALANEAVKGSSANQPLFLNLKFPARRVLFRLVGEQSTPVVLKAFDLLGTELGTVTHIGLTGGENSLGTPLGIEAVGQLGIAKILIDYGSSTIPEQVENLTVEFISRPVFTTFLAQIGDGTAGNTRLQTIVSLANPDPSFKAKGKLKFFDSGGSPLALAVDGRTASEFDFEVPNSGSITLSTAGTGPLRAGYAKIEPDRLVEATAVFRMLDSSTGALMAEAAIVSATGKVSLVGTVHKIVDEGVDSGIALVNTSSAATTVELRMSADGLAPTTRLNLGPGEHRAKFVSDLFPTQLFPELASRSFKGSIAVNSIEPISIVILRTSKGLATSSLPLASTEAN